MKIEEIDLKGKVLLTEVLTEKSRWTLDEDVACSRINGFVDELNLPKRYALLMEVWWDEEFNNHIFYRLAEYDRETDIIASATPAVPDKKIIHWILAGLTMGISNHVTNIHKLITNLSEEK